MTYHSSNNLLRRHSFVHNRLSQTQLGMDGALSSFSQQAADPATLAAMTLGSFAFRAIKLITMEGFAASGLTRVAPRFLLNTAASALALGGEVATFRTANNSFATLAGHRVQQGVFDHDGFLGTLADFAAIKILSPLGHHNPFLANFAQTNAMVLGHEISADLGFTAHEEGSYIQRLAHAQVTNFAMGAGMSLMNRMSGGKIHAAERTLDARLSSSNITRNHELPSPTTASNFIPYFQAEGFSSSSRRQRSDEIALRLDQIAEPHLQRVREEKLPPSSREVTTMNIGVLTSGGDGPGENAVIQSLVIGARTLYPEKFRFYGILDGFKGLLEPEGRIFHLTPSDLIGKAAVARAMEQVYGKAHFRTKTTHVAQVGGNILRSSRTNPLKDDPTASRVKETMESQGIDALVVLGGNGSMGASLDLYRQGVPLVFMPQTIDNDIPGSDVSVGFPSAVLTGTEAVRNFYHTGQSCERWFIVEVMGQHSGALALAIARRTKVEGIFIGEYPRPLSEIRHIIESAAHRGQKHGVILVSEAARFLDDQGGEIDFPKKYDERGRLLHESGDMARWVMQQVGSQHIRTEVLAYLLRGAKPSPHEIDMASVLALGALRILETEQYGRMSGLVFQNGRWRRVYPFLANIHGQKHQLQAEEYRIALAELGQTQD